jgi:nitrite reductase/ring-hydroxylating ferredoxin subunit
VCPTVALAFFGVTMLEACSSGGDESPANSGGNNNNGGNNNTSGYSVSGSTVSITLSNSNFVKLQNDGWMNFTAQNMLLLKIDASTYRAFTNACPHQGTRTMWSYNTSDDTFKCGNHQGVYPTDCTTNGSNGGPLKCYTTSLKDGILSVTK